MSVDENDVDQAGNGVEQTSRRTPQDTTELFDVARGQGEAIRQLSGRVAQLTRVQAANQALAKLSPAEVREALMDRHNNARGRRVEEQR